MSAIVGIKCKGGLKIELHHTNQTSIRLRNLCVSNYFHFKSHLKQLYKSNKMEYFSYKCGFGICKVLRY